MMTTTTDSSVMVALSELAKMETRRIDDERALAAKQAREAEEKAAREAAAAAKAAAEAALRKESALAEAKLRVEAELDHERRLAAMRAELESIRRDRDVIHGTLAARMAAPIEPQRRSGLAVAFGISSSIAAALAALLVVQASAARTPVRAEAPAPVHVVETAPLPAPEAIEAAASDVEAAPAEPAVVATPVTGRTGHGTRGDRVRPPRHEDEPAHTLGHDLDFGSGDGMLPTEHR